MSLLLYWYPFSGSLAPMAILEETETPYEKILIDIKAGENHRPEYLLIHPLGLVPAFRLDNGRYIFESAGICMYLADRFMEFGLAPPIDDPERAVYNQWMFFLADSIYPVFGRIAHPERYSTDPSHHQGIKAAAISHQNVQWKVLEHVLDNSSWLLGEHFSATDIFLHMLSTWVEDEIEFMGMFPNIARVTAAIAKRPGVQRALRLHAI